LRDQVKQKVLQLRQNVVAFSQVIFSKKVFRWGFAPQTPNPPCRVLRPF
jgi:hypothetical protein